MTTRILPPHDAEAEEAALSAALFSDPARRVLLDALDEADYYRAFHRLVHRAVAALTHEGDGVDPVSVAAWLDASLRDAERAAWEREGRQRLATLAAATGVAALTRQYAATIKRHALARRALLLVEEASRSIYEGADPTTVLTDHAHAVQRLAATGHNRRVHRLADVAAEWIAEVRLDAQDDGLRFGWPTIDRLLTTPIRRGELVTVAARSGVGKTFGLLDVTAHMLATRPSIGAVFASLEMPRTQIFERIAAQALDEQTDSLRRYALDDDAVWSAIEQSRPEVDRLRIHDRSVTVDDLHRLCESARADGIDPAVVCVDYLGLVKWDGRKNATTYERVSDIARRLKDVALAEGTIVIAAAQLNRDGGGGERPTIEMIRDSGAIEEASDRIVALWAPERKATLTPAERAALRPYVSAALLKNRNGPLGDDAELQYSRGRRLREVAN